MRTNNTPEIKSLMAAVSRTSTERAKLRQCRDFRVYASKDNKQQCGAIQNEYRAVYFCTNPPPTIWATMARKHLAEGVARRWLMIADSLNVIDTIAADGRTACLDTQETADLNLHLNSYYVHLRGTLDKGGARVTR
jgi:hypothetical protein